jgi:hypothetical protein
MPEAGHDLVQKISSTETNSYDEVATEAVENFIRREEGSPSLAIVLHLYGQHFFYEDRYPSGLFEPEPAPASPTELEELRYQRAAEYGAQVLARAARMLDGLPTPAYLVFTSDHGENLLRPQRQAFPRRPGQQPAGHPGARPRAMEPGLRAIRAPAPARGAARHRADHPPRPRPRLARPARRPWPPHPGRRADDLGRDRRPAGRPLRCGDLPP